MKARILTLMLSLFLLILTSCEKEESDNAEAGILNFSIKEFKEIESADIPTSIKMVVDNFTHGGGTVSVQITGGEYGVDYETSTGSASFDVEILSGTLITDFTIIPIDNEAIDGDKNLTIILSNNTGALELGEQISIAYTILDDDDPVIAKVDFAETNLSIDENNATGTEVTFTFDEASTFGGAINIESTGIAVFGTDYLVDGQSLASFSIKVSPGASSASFMVIAIDNAEFDVNKTAIFTITEVSGGLSKGGANSVELTIVNDDAPIYPTVSFNTVAETVTEDTGSITLNLSFSEAITEAGTIEFTIGGSATILEDFTIEGTTSNPYILNAEVGNTNAFITIEVNDDTDTESLETIILDIVGTTGGVAVGDSNQQFTASIEASDNIVPFVYSHTFEDYLEGETLENYDFEILFGNQTIDKTAFAITRQAQLGKGLYPSLEDLNGSSDSGFQMKAFAASDATIVEGSTLDCILVSPLMEVTGNLTYNIDMTFYQANDTSSEVEFYYSETYAGSGEWNESDWNLLGAETVATMVGQGFARKDFKRQEFNFPTTNNCYVAVRVKNTFDASGAMKVQWRLDNLKVTN